MDKFNLERGEVRSVQVRSGDEFRCGTGIFWLTLDGQNEDYLLRAGQVWKAPHAGKVVGEALETGEVEISPSAALSVAARFKAVWSWRRPVKSPHNVAGSRTSCAV